jgi:hypothetical protein
MLLVPLVGMTPGVQGVDSVVLSILLLVADQAAGLFFRLTGGSRSPPLAPTLMCFLLIQVGPAPWLASAFVVFHPL